MVAVEDFFSPSQAARRLGLSVAMVQYLMRTGKLEYQQTALGRLIKPKSLDSLIEERQQQASLHQRRR